MRVHCYQFIIFGYDPQSFAIEHFKIVGGEGLSDSKQVIIGKGAAKNFKKGVGDSLENMERTW